MLDAPGNKILLSAIIPITKMAGNLKNLQQTLLNAATQDLEIILVHDKRDEETGPELALLINEYPDLNVRMIEGTYGNPGAARNVGLREAVGVWVAFWDSDDVAFASEIFSAIKQAPSSVRVIVGQSRVFNLTTQKEFKVKHTSHVRDLPKFPGIWRMIFKNENLIEFNSLRMGEDQLFIARNLRDVENLYFSPNYFYTYFTGSPSQLTGKKKSVNDLQVVIIEELKLIKSASPYLKPFIFELIFRQIVTCFKFGDSKVKIAIINLLPKLGRYSIQVLRIMYISRANNALESQGSPNVVVSLTGGLGNQLFQFAAACSIAKKSIPGLITELGAPRVSGGGVADLYEYELDKIAKKLNRRPATRFEQRVAGFGLRMGVAPKKLENVKLVERILQRIISFFLSSHLGRIVKLQVGKGVGYCELSEATSPTLLLGYFQSFRWVQEEANLNRFRKLHLQNVSKFVSEMRDRADGKRILCVHIRLGDYKNETNFGILDVNYYQRALNILSKKTDYSEIWIFSDEPSLAQKFYQLNANIPIIWMDKQHVSSAETLEVMRLCSGFIIANSTFSWWAAMLSHKRESFVIAPSKWFKGMDDPIDLIPVQWETLTPSYLEINSLGNER